MSAETSQSNRRDRWLTAAIIIITVTLVGYNLVMFYGQSYFLKGKKVEKLLLADPKSGAEKEIVIPGGTVLLNFWATWCSSCVYELPTLKEYASKVTIIGVLKAPVRTDQLHDMDLTWENYLGPDDIFSEFMIAGVPVTMLLRDRAIVAVHTGPVTREVLDEWLTAPR
ncbi:MAG TPA: TlpA disulfide reductase family protein [bacterium]|nr:TlpA disulfide reductase family protein [bacterium]